MTKMLELVGSRVKQLSAEQQDGIAALILKELKDDAGWDAAFSGAPDVLTQLAAAAEEEDRKGPAKELAPDTAFVVGESHLDRQDKRALRNA